jgi:hypothetical protein
MATRGSYKADLATLQRSHDELRAMLRISARELRRLPKSDRKDVLIEKLREVLAEARSVRKATAAMRAVSGK